MAAQRIDEWMPYRRGCCQRLSPQLAGPAPLMQARIDVAQMSCHVDELSPDLKFTASLEAERAVLDGGIHIPTIGGKHAQLVKCARF